MNCAGVDVFHFAIVEDREVFPRYELTGWVILGLPAKETICARLATVPLLRAASGSLLDGRAFYQQCARVSKLFCMAVR